MTLKNVSAQVLSVYLAALAAPVVLEGSQGLASIDVVQGARNLINDLPQCTDQNLPDRAGVNEVPQCLLEQTKNFQQKTSSGINFVDCSFPVLDPKVDGELSSLSEKTRQNIGCTVFMLNELGQPEFVDLSSVPSFE